MKSLCIYCGASFGASPVYADAARAMAKVMVDDNIGLVYGGGSVGLMGVIADEVLRLGGQAIGVIPQAMMDKEVGHLGLTRQHVVKDMHERKALMADLSDGFIALPGGIGTLEELFEMFSWGLLGFHEKPIGLLNATGYYQGLLDFLRHVVDQRFLRAEYASLLIDESEPAALLQKMKAFKPQPMNKLLDARSARQVV
jgi:uncharacterized protein (TIGR00730 family)